MTERAFLLYSNGTVEEIDEEGETLTFATGSDMYGKLVAAGYPIYDDSQGKAFDKIVDVTTDGETGATVHSIGPKPREHRMKDADAAMFLGWVHEVDGRD